MNSLKILKIIAISLGIILLGTGGYWIYTAYIAKDKITTSDADTYTCPMHPQIVQDRPGICPICNMDLVKKSELDEEDTDMDHDLGSADIHTVKLSPSQQVLANVQTEAVTTRTFSGEKTFNGYIKINEKNFSHISTAVAGKIVKMYVNFEGQEVRKGQPVMEIYSPELVSTQKEFLLALNNFTQVKKSGNVIAIEQAGSLVEASKRRLLQWEMTDGQIAELENSGVVQNTMTLYSKYSGTITKKYVHVGHWAMDGEDIYDVADLSNVWVIANIYESDAALITKGQSADIYSASYPNEILRAKVNFVNPVFNPESRTMEVRIDVSNHNMKLKPDMYVKVKINTFAGQTIAVPKNAVIRTGERNIVYVEKEKGLYEPREVQLSYEQDGYYAVISGLNEGEKVVSSGGFLLDSESQIQTGFKTGHEQHNIKENEDGLKINPDQDIMKDIENKNKEHKH